MVTTKTKDRATVEATVTTKNKDRATVEAIIKSRFVGKPLKENGVEFIPVEGIKVRLFRDDREHPYFLYAIPLSKCERDDEAQPRQYDPSAAQRIADSIKKKVLMQPILCRYDDQRDVCLVTEGQHRRGAAKDVLGWDRIPALVYIDMDKHMALLCGLEANAEDRARALSGGDLARKTHALMAEYSDLLRKERPNEPVTEARVLGRMGVTTRARQRKFLLGKILEDLRESPNAKIRKFISDRQSHKFPITAQNLMNFLAKLVRVNPVEDAERSFRDDELINLIRLTDIFTDEVMEHGKWDPEDSDKQSHAHAGAICKDRPLEVCGHFLAKVVERFGGGDASIGACYVKAGTLQWDRIEKCMRNILSDPIWDQPHVVGNRSREELIDILQKQGWL